MFRFPQLNYRQNYTTSPVSTVSTTLRCTDKFNLPQTNTYTQTPITQNDLNQFNNFNIDLKELNYLFKDIDKKKTQKNNNIKKISKKKSSTQSNRNSIEKNYKQEELKFVNTIKKILSEKLKVKTLKRLERLIKNPKEKRLNKVACVIKALLEVLKSCNATIMSNEQLINLFQTASAKVPGVADGAREFIKNILEKTDKSLPDFIHKQKIYQKKLGELLIQTINNLQTCRA